MEHSYARDWRPNQTLEAFTASGLPVMRSLLMHRPPPCPSCHTNPQQQLEDAATAAIDMDDVFNTPVPAYNEAEASAAMLESEEMARDICKTSDDENWAEKIDKSLWTSHQHRLWNQIVQILDNDMLARQAQTGLLHEPVLRRTIIERSAQRVRQLMSTVSWETRTTQWLHITLQDHLNPRYMAAYIDIMRELKRRLPVLVGHMTQLTNAIPGTVSNRAIANCLQRPAQSWPNLIPKNRHLNECVFVVVPSVLGLYLRIEKWIKSFQTMTTVRVIQLQLEYQDTLDQVTDGMVAVSRVKLQEIRQEFPNKELVLIGFNAGSSLAIQLSTMETVTAVVCLGFAFHTPGGTRLDPDDIILQMKTPVLFVIGELSNRASVAEMESLRETMVSSSSLLVVGSGDDCLRISKHKQLLERVNQEMLDDMVLDEISDYVNGVITKPPPQRKVANRFTIVKKQLSDAVKRAIKKDKSPTKGCKTTAASSKRRHTDGKTSTEPPIKRKVGRPRLNRTVNETITSEPIPSTSTATSAELNPVASGSGLSSSNGGLQIPADVDLNLDDDVDLDIKGLGEFSEINFDEIDTDLDLKDIISDFDDVTSSSSRNGLQMNTINSTTNNNNINLITTNTTPTTAVSSISTLHTTPTRLPLSSTNTLKRSINIYQTSPGSNTLSASSPASSSNSQGSSITTFMPTTTKIPKMDNHQKHHIVHYKVPATAAGGAGGFIGSSGQIPQTITFKHFPKDASSHLQPQKQQSSFTTTTRHVQQQQQPLQMKTIQLSTNKFTVMKPGSLIISNNQIKEHVSNNVNHKFNINDMPIVFADCDGNIQDAPAGTSSNLSTVTTSIVNNNGVTTMKPLTAIGLVSSTHQPQQQNMQTNLVRKMMSPMNNNTINNKGGYVVFNNNKTFSSNNINLTIKKDGQQSQQQHRLVSTLSGGSVGLTNSISSRQTAITSPMRQNMIFNKLTTTNLTTSSPAIKIRGANGVGNTILIKPNQLKPVVAGNMRTLGNVVLNRKSFDLHKLVSVDPSSITKTTYIQHQHGN